MAETTKLSVGQALDKLRGTEMPKTRMAQLDDKIGALEEETQRMRAMGRQLERSQQAVSTLDGSQKTSVGRVSTTKIVWTVIGIVIVIPILVWMVGLFSR
jgi:hypothetical protein